MKKLKIPETYIEYEVKDKNGKLVDKRRFKGQSWVGNIIGLLSALCSMWTNASVTQFTTPPSRTDIRDTGGTWRGLLLGNHSTGPYLGSAAPVGETTAGIVAGSSDTPVAIGQYSLGALIAHGSGAGQLQYGATTVEPIVTDTAYYFRIVRTFSNASGSTVTVREIGHYVRLGLTASPYYYSVMLARDVPTSPISVPAGSTLTVRYIISHSIT